MVQSIPLRFATLDQVREHNAPTDIDDCHEVYGDRWDDDVLDELLARYNDCTDPGGHIFVAEGGECHCMHCGAKP